MQVTVRSGNSRGSLVLLPLCRLPQCLRCIPGTGRIIRLPMAVTTCHGSDESSSNTIPPSTSQTSPTSRSPGSGRSAHSPFSSLLPLPAYWQIRSARRYPSLLGPSLSCWRPSWYPFARSTTNSSSPRQYSWVSACASSPSQPAAWFHATLTGTEDWRLASQSEAHRSEVCSGLLRSIRCSTMMASASRGPCALQASS